MLRQYKVDRFRPVVISPHKDELLEHTRGYSSGSKPEDYLYAFGSTLISHEARIRQAVDKLKKAHKFSKQELNWMHSPRKPRKLGCPARTFAFRH